MKNMFENLSYKKRTGVYLIIALIATLIISYLNLIFYGNIYYVIFAAIILFFCIFYILYLPLKVQRQREKEEKKK